MTWRTAGGTLRCWNACWLSLKRGIRETWPRFSPAQREYIELADRLWREVKSRTERYPRHKEFADLLDYDYRQLGNVMRYSHLINRCPEMLNEAEHDIYTPHNMHIMICSTIDLMASPAFERRELGRLRELIWHAQCMGRIGNLVTTWQREVHERDFTSGIFARALSTGVISIEQLLNTNVDELRELLQQRRPRTILSRPLASPSAFPARTRAGAEIV